MNTLKKYWHFLLIFFIWLIFALPYFFKNSIPFPSTYQQTSFAPWSAYKQYIGPVKNGAMPDIITQIFPWKYFSVKELKNGKIPLWNPFSFGGTPHLANYQSAVLNPFNFIFFLFSFVQSWRLFILLQPLLAGIFTLLYTGRIRTRKTGSVLSAISFMFCGFITTWMAYGTLGYAIIFLPLALYSIESYVANKKKRYLFLLGVCLPLSFFSGHFQTSIYFLLFAILYAVYAGSNLINRQEQALLGISILLGIVCTMAQVLPSLEFYTQSLRSKLYQSMEVIPWKYLPTLIIPDFFGNPVTRNDWFGHYAEWNGYTGVVALLLSLFSLGSSKKKTVLFFWLTAVIALLLAFSSPLSLLFVWLKVPVLGTSAASRVIVIFSFSVSILGGIGFDQLFVKIQKKFFMLWIIVSTLFILSIWFFIFSHFGLTPEQAYIARQNSILPTIIFLLTITITFAIWKLRKINKALFIICIILLTSIDMLRFVIKWMPADSFSLAFSSVPIERTFQKIVLKGRVLGNMESGMCTYYALQCLGGYDPLYIDRYGEFISSLETGKLTHADRSVVTFPLQGKYTLQAINLLNVRYILHKHSDDFVGWTFPYWKYSDQFIQIADDGVYKVLANKNAYPMAFLVNKYITAKTDQDILDSMFAKKINLSKIIVLEKPINVFLNAKQMSAQIISQKPGDFNLQTQTNGSALLFLSSPYYTGWRATIDGKETQIQRADFAFQAVVVPAGTHRVIFDYHPLSFTLGVILSVMGFVGLIILGFYKNQSSTKNSIKRS